MDQEDCGCGRPAGSTGAIGSSTDRYVSFAGIDCAGNARRLMESLDRHIADPAKNNAFWQYFNQRRYGGSGPRPDDLMLIHSYLNQIREFLESCADEEALALLQQIEEECC